jgi:energy-coupling factor transporter transmembrane protein EcfT
LLLRSSTRKKVLLFGDWIAIFLVAVFLMIVAVMPDAEIRYLGAALWLAAAMGVWFALLIFEEFLPRHQRAAEILLLLAFLGLSKLPTHFLWKFFRSTPGEAYVLKHTAGEAKAWLRDHAGDRLVVVNADNETYYLSTIRSTVLTEQPDIDHATYGQKDGFLFLQGLCESSKATFLLDSRATEFGLHLRFPRLPWSDVILFQAQGSRVYDLRRLQELVLKRDVGCGRE